MKTLAQHFKNFPLWTVAVANTVFNAACNFTDLLDLDGTNIKTTPTTDSDLVDSDDSSGVQPIVYFPTTTQTVAENVGTVSVTVKVNNTSSSTITAAYTVSGTASNPADHDLAAGTVEFTSGVTEQELTITVANDTLDENSETVIVTLTTATNASVGPTSIATYTLTITDNDATPTVQFSAATLSVGEAAGTGTLTFDLSAASGLAVSIPFSVTAGTATVTSDYSFATTSPASIPAGSTSVDVTINIVSDVLDEGDETLTVTMGTPTNATAGATTANVVTITDDDAAPTVNFSAASQTIAESVGLVTITASLSTTSGLDVTVPYTVSGTAANPADHDLANGSITILAGATSGTATFTAVDDAIDEITETVIATMGGPTNATAGATNVHTVSITDNDATPTVQWTAASQSGDEDTVGTMTFTAQLSAASGLDVTVPFAITGTATGGGTDYSITASPLTILAGATTADVTITVATDLLDEPNETVIGTIGTPTNATAGATSVHTATITDDDATPTVQWTAVSQSGAENVGTITVTAQLSAVSGLAVTVPYTLTGTATGGGTDYSVTASPITIAAGQATTDVTITVSNDTLDETDETAILTIGTPTNATVGATSVHTATITDNDAAPTVTFTSASQTTAETATTITVTAQLSAVSELDVSLPFTLAGTATLTSDYTITASPITITAGSLSSNISITIVDDSVAEQDETVIVNMGAPTNASTGATTSHTATISLNDQTFTVNYTTSDTSDATAGDGICEIAAGSGNCTLRAAIEESNATTGTQTISIPTATTITLGGSQLSITSEVTITGGSQTTTIIDAVHGSRVFSITAATTMSDLLIENGTANGTGGCINITNVTVSLTNVTVQNCSTMTQDGGGIYVTGAAGVLNLTESKLLDNTAGAGGGGVYLAANSTAAIDYSTFKDNTSVGGGGIYINTGATFTIQRSLFDGNSSTTLNGGGIYTLRPLTVTNVTFYQNTATSGPAMYADNTGGNVDLTNTTLTQNTTYGGGTDTGGILSNGGTSVVRFKNVINVLNTTTSGGTIDNCQSTGGGTFTSLGNNMTDTTSGDCNIVDGTDIPSCVTGLGALQDNGGPSESILLTGASDGLDSGTNTGCPATDQRGFARPANTTCDMGAVEVQ